MHFTKSAFCGMSALTMSLGLAFTAAPVVAETPICGTPYTVAPGDSLSKIAFGAYGPSGNFQIIFSANTDVIGSNPGLIKVGSTLQIPCLDTAEDESIADASVMTEVETTEQLPAPTDDLIRIVVGSGWAPFTEETLEQGGMITEITNVSMAQSASKPEYRIDFIKDWGAHLNPLISDHMYDLSIAWFRPNCNVMDLLSEDSKFRCNNLDWSESLFEQVFGYYTKVGAPEITAYHQLQGKTICRPEGYSTFMMEEEGLSEPVVELIRAASPEDCFAGLSDGTFDAVALAHDTAQSVMTKEGLKDEVFYNESISQSLTLHAVTAKTNPDGQAVLAVLDNGLKKIKDNGEWFKIIRRHLNKHRALVN